MFIHIIKQINYQFILTSVIMIFNFNHFLYLIVFKFILFKEEKILLYYCKYIKQNVFRFTKLISNNNK